MSTRIRLQRHGKKGKPFFHIVVADQRSKRDGRYIERLGSYNPNTNPATIDLDFDRSVYWVAVGAEPSDTARAILSYRGVLHKEHLLRGVKKGALTEEQAETKFNAWLDEKGSRIQSKVDTLAKVDADALNARLAAEKEVNDARITARNQELAEAAAPAEEPATEEAPAEEAAAPAEEPATEEAPAEEAAAPAEEPATEEAPAEEAAAPA
ncbi:MAG: 30S ribosomal protein S16, partial [Gammaproteobacteria bacterium]|nr:30S ribosomal protein S16 [Gammaproteobacteria bacterium]